MPTDNEQGLLSGMRVIELATGISGPYSGKMLVDAGAEVVKLEPRSGDPLRTWSASGSRPEREDGALFRYLNASKRSVVIEEGDHVLTDLFACANLVIENGQLADDQITALRDTHPHLSFVSVTPFGKRGPRSDDPVTEFTLQALCGSTLGRGTTDREPLHAGGRLGEWIAGTYAAAAAAALLFGAARTGQGDHADVSQYEAMAVTMGGYGSLMQSFTGSEFAPRRSIELPSIEPTGDDGYVGFCTITRQQFSDFLVMIGRGDLTDDDDLASFVGRENRREEFLGYVHEWTTRRSTDEIIELAEAFRIPVAPLGEPSKIMACDHFVDRGVFVSNPHGFLQPRRPYVVDDRPLPSVGRAPGLGEGPVPNWEPVSTPDGPTTSTLPLEGVRVVDLTAFWAGPSTTQLLASLGADVIKVESVQRPDGMRFSGGHGAGDKWWEWGSIFHAVNINKRDVTLDLGQDEGRRLLLDLVGRSDVIVENFSPRVMDGFGLTRSEIFQSNPKIVFCRMPAFGLSGPWRDRVGFAQTMEQASGMAWLTGFPDRPPVIPRGPCDPIAGTHAAFAIISSLSDVRRTGAGHHLECAMVESALNVAAEIVLEQQAYGVELRRVANRGPCSAPQGVYRCDGDDAWLAIAVETDEQWQRLAALIDDETWMLSDGRDVASGRRKHADEIDIRISRWTATREAKATAAELRAHGVPASELVGGTDVVHDPHLRERGFVEVFDHPIVGRHEVIGIPFRLGSRRSEPWLRTPAPTLGQHNREVLAGLLGLDDAALADLAAGDVTGYVPMGA